MDEKQTVSYREFGAIGDGKTNDIEAIIRTHAYANQHGCKVVADKGAKYYIGYTAESAIIKTDVDFGDAEFIIDDTAPGVHEKRETPIFHVVSDNPCVAYDSVSLSRIPGEKTVRAGDSKIPWLAELLTEKSLVKLQNSKHKDFVRFGNSFNVGSPRQEMILVDKDGNVDEQVPVTFDYETVTDLLVISLQDRPITIEGGKFFSICCRTCADSDYKNKYLAYRRNLMIQRSNVTLKGLDHKMLAEPVFSGKQDESYPYVGFVAVFRAANVKILDCDLTGHKTYYEDKTATVNNPRAPMGSYDLNMRDSVGVYLDNITQSQVPVGDYQYWGIMGSNYCKDLTFINCKLSRFDAHCGFWNAKIIDCEFGQTINVIGGGELYIENTKRTVGDAFIRLRQDYGATFNGTVVLKNCTLCGYADYDTNDPGVDGLDENNRCETGYVFFPKVRDGFHTTDPRQNYYTWDFGYARYMPQNIYVENFKSGANRTFLFNDVRDEHICKADKSKEYQRPQKIVLKDCTQEIPICENKEGVCSLLAAVPVERV